MDVGSTGVILSNHGGRQLDGSRSPFDQLKEIVDEVGNEIDAIMDSGVQRGTHIIKALSLGAKAVGLGRHYLFPVNGGLKPCQCGGAKVGHFMSRLGA
ncbi:alpha-hydroxy-acid oxidizing protein [Paracoccaceae bacterium]|nr:alpha-hydroxy-acid oxidizing protein [Paracoccaceae bacterium]MDC0583819.1 alpha-hydroxy-acid oxidizing protein [Paracoccaceae bacterium]